VLRSYSCSPVHIGQHQQAGNIITPVVNEHTTAALRFALSNICCWPRVARAAQSRPNGRQRLRRKSTFNDTELLHEPKKHIEYRRRGTNKKRRKKDEARGTWSRACALHPWSCRPCSRVALIGVALPPALFVSFVLCFHRLLDGWEACTRCFAGPVIELDRLVV
jgi:hypothetical protein